MRTTREFQVFLNNGEYFQLAIVKGDLRISVAIYEPGGRQIVEYQSHRYEPIELGVVAGASGVFLLKINSLETTTRQDQFVLTVLPIRRATSEDYKNAAATSAIATATRFGAEWTRASLKKAIDKYTEAATLAADSRISALALRKAGDTRYVLGEYRPALELFARAAALSERSNGQQEFLENTIQTARLNSLLGNNDRASQEITRVLGYYSARNIETETQANKQVYAQALSCKGEILYSMGDFIRSPDYFERALKLFVEVIDRNGQANAVLYKGHFSIASGQLALAMSYFDQVLNLYREAGNLSGEGLATTGRGTTYALSGKDELGIKLHRDAMHTFEEVGDFQGKAITLNGIGQAYQHLNENKLALDYYKQALKLFQDGQTIDYIPVTLFQIATLYKGMKDFETALMQLEDCVSVSRANKKRRMEAYALNEIASIYALQGNQSKALAQYHKVFRFHSSIGDHRGQVMALNNIGDLHLAAGRKQEALGVYRQALPMSKHVGEREVEIGTLYNLARATRDAGSIDEAMLYIESSINMIETLRTNVASADYRSSYFSGLRKHYDLYIGLLFRLERERPGQGFLDKALIASERARARAFLEQLVEAGADIRDGVDPSLLKRERELQRLLAAHAAYELEAAVSKQPDSERVELNQRVDLLKAECEELEAQVRNESPRYQALSRPKPLTVGEIQAQLGQDDLLLEYVLGEEKSYLFAVTPTTMKGYELEPKSVIESSALEFYKLITARQQTSDIADGKYQSRIDKADAQVPEKALSLSRMLLEPVASDLGHKRLVIVAEGVLQYVPFDALPHPVSQQHDSNSSNTDSLSRHEIVLLPSVSALAAIRAEINRAVSSSGVVAVFADPVFSNSDARVEKRKEGSTELASGVPGVPEPAFRGFVGVNERGGLRRLAYAADEADSIYAAARGNAWIVKGFDASRENVMSDRVGHYQIVHFATHGFVNTERPELSGIVFSLIKPDGTPVDGFLQLHDVFSLKLSAELTVLSACDTGLGKDVRGEGLIGLTRGLMFAGSRSVVASLWKVDDRATAVFMAHFYKALLQDKMSRAAALRYAKEQLRKEPSWSSPFFWAGFVLQGEYDRPIVAEQRVSRVSASLILLMTVVGISAILLIVRRVYRVRE
ncbi:MAG TPA: CHAT domain-containing tetratricopeptide repeat protein [Pyrinomonadaceae bacterium]|nr:CHAT domain-containing tetratricopeptide repeat protein [Pyrinomonadaceae bacterium]